MRQFFPVFLVSLTFVRNGYGNGGGRLKGGCGVRKLFLGIAVSFLSLPISAQTTRCTTVGNQTVCRETPAGGVDWGLLQPQGNSATDALNAFEEGRRRAEEERARAQAYQQQQLYLEQLRLDGEARRVEAERQSVAIALRQSVGIKLRSGDCDAAVGEALQAGDIELAQAAKGLCIKR